MDSFTLHFADALINLTGAVALALVWTQRRALSEFAYWSVSLLLFSFALTSEFFLDVDSPMRGLQIGVMVLALALWGAGFRAFDGARPIERHVMILPVAAALSFTILHAATGSVQTAEGVAALFWLILGIRVVHFVGWGMKERSVYRTILASMMAAQIIATAVLVVAIGPFFGEAISMIAIPLIDLSVTAVILTALLGLTVERQFRMVERLAYHDALTGILNRSGLKQRSTGLSNTGVLVVDLDHFKRINDQHGHDGGDRVLRGFVERTLCLLPDNAIFARVGGEEFVILLPDRDLVQARLVANKICLSMRHTPLSLGDRDVKVTTSIGVGYRSESEGLGSAIKRADIALYQAKACGRDQVQHLPQDAAEPLMTMASA